MRAPHVAATVLLTGLLVMVGGCTDEPTPSTATPTTAAAATPATATTTGPTTQPVEPSAQPPQPVAQSWVMPDLVGSNLQAAQDAIQALTEFNIVITTSTDVSGNDRAQVLDANWKVCSQNVAAGATITAATGIDFGVVKLEERCP